MSAISMGQRYAVGRKFERLVYARLVDLGYAVTRAPASKGIYDIMALRRDGALLVQCKRGGSIRPGEWNALWALAIDKGAIPILAVAGRTVEEVVLYRLTDVRMPRSRLPAPQVPWDGSPETR